MARPSHSPPSLALWPRQPCGSVKRPPSCAHSGVVSRAVPGPRVAGSDALGTVQQRGVRWVSAPSTCRTPLAPAVPRRLCHAPCHVGQEAGRDCRSLRPHPAPRPLPGSMQGCTVGGGAWPPDLNYPAREHPPELGQRSASLSSAVVAVPLGGASRGPVPMLQREGRTAPGQREGLVLGADLNVHLKVLIY